MTALHNFKIFLVDDDLFSLNLYRQHIRNLGYQDITTFENGTTCLNQLNQNPEVIFLDHNMDVLNGFELLKKIKRFNPNTYVVMVSGQEKLQTAVDALRYGAFDYIIKGDHETDKMSKVLQRITQVEEMLKKSKPSLLKKIFTYL